MRVKFDSNVINGAMHGLEFINFEFLGLVDCCRLSKSNEGFRAANDMKFDSPPEESLRK